MEEDTNSELHLWARYVNPVLAGLYAAAGLDKRFVRADGTHLEDSTGRRYLDFLAGYGSVPLGHHPAALWAVVHAAEQSREPIFSIPALLDGAGRLAEALVKAAAAEGNNNDDEAKQQRQLRFAMFANSGSEAVEWAIKLARTHTQRLGVLSTWNSYHGKTLGALSASGRTQYHGVGAPAEGFEFVAFGDAAALRAKFEEAHDKGAQYAAFLVEPIQGEGGIVVPPAGYLREVRALCTQFGVLLIADEIQTGLGRTGRLFAYQHDDIVPDIVALSKALSGGMYPIGAILYTEDCMSEEYLFKQSSTFAGGSLGCRIGLRTVELITADDGALMRNAAVMGAYLRDGVEALRASDADFARVLTAVRGVGLMLGIEFSGKRETFGHSFLGVLAQQKILSVMISSYMLNVKGIRLANALNKMNTLRVQPALIVSREECDTFLGALRDVLVLLKHGDAGGLMAHLAGPRTSDDAGDASEASTDGSRSEPSSSSSSSGKRVFVVCARTWDDFRRVDEASFAAFSPGQMRTLAAKLSALLVPWHFTSAQGHEFVFIPSTTEQLESASLEESMGEIAQAVALAASTTSEAVQIGLGGGLSRVLAQAEARTLLDAMGAAHPHARLSHGLTATENTSAFPAAWSDP